MAGFIPAPRAEAALFNPAFLTLIVAATARGYREITKSGLPYELAFLAAGLALNEETRRAFPANTNRRMSSWVLENPVIAAEFPLRAKALVPLVRDGIRYGLRARSLRLEGGSLISHVPGSAPSHLRSRDARDCVRSSAFVGRWFAHTGDPATIFALLGVRP